MTIVEHHQNAEADIENLRSNVVSVIGMLESFSNLSEQLKGIVSATKLTEALQRIKPTAESVASNMTELLYKARHKTFWQRGEWALFGKAKMEEMSIQAEQIKSTFTMGMSIINV